jgi:hypothetical protein
MNLSQVKAKILNGFARPNLFRVSFANIVASKAEVFRINCYQAQIPGSNLAITDKDAGFRSSAYHRLYSDIILGFYCSENMQELKLFQDWIDMIVNPVTNVKGYYSSDLSDQKSTGYTTTVTIEHLSRLSSKGGDYDLGQPAPKLGSTPKIREQELYEKKGMSYDKENVVTAKWTLKEAFPRQVDPIQLDYGTNDTVMSMNVTLTYRSFEADFSPFTMEQYPLTTAQIYARDELGQKTGKENMRGAVGSAFRGG